MKMILTGNEGIARGAYEAGVVIASGYPGTPSTEILESIGKRYPEIRADWAPNEKVALEEVCGSAIGGVRSMCTMKHVGLNVAADPLFTIAYEGVNAGLVIVVADEPGMPSSQNEQDNRYYAKHAKVALVEPADSQECIDYMKEAFEISEKFDTVVILRLTTRVSHSKSLVEFKDRIEAPYKEYEKDIKKYIMVPANSRPKHVEMETERIPAMREYSNNTFLNRIEYNDKKIGVITNGMAYNHARSVFGENASYLKVGFSYPLPDKLFKEFSENVDTLYIVEENEPYMEEFAKAMGIECIGKEIFPICGELNPQIIQDAVYGKTEDLKTPKESEQDIPNRPPSLCPGCPHRGIFYEISKYKDSIVSTSDIGCYTLGMAPPLSIGDTVICMGAGFSAGIGFERAFKAAGITNKKVFGFVGDSTFFHSGITGLVDMVYSNTNMVAVILDNSITAMTGHQDNPSTGKNLKGEIANVVDIKAVCKGCGIPENKIVEFDPYDLKATENAVRIAYESEGPFVLVSKRECALIKDIMKQRAHLKCKVDPMVCISCKYCLDVGCPAISMKGVSVIDKTQCNGCSICSQVCHTGAIQQMEDYNGK